MIVARLSNFCINLLSLYTRNLNTPLRIFSAVCTSRLWYASTRSVMAVIWELFLYLDKYVNSVLEYTVLFRYIRLRFLTIERIHCTSSEHICKHKVFQNLYPLRRSSFVVIFERFEEIHECSIPLPLLQVNNYVASMTEHSRSPIHILPPHSLMTPMILGCGIAERTSFVALYISWQSLA